MKYYDYFHGIEINCNMAYINQVTTDGKQMMIKTNFKNIVSTFINKKVCTNRKIAFFIRKDNKNRLNKQFLF